MYNLCSLCLLTLSPGSHSEKRLKFEQRWKPVSQGQPGGPTVLLHTFVPEKLSMG